LSIDSLDELDESIQSLKYDYSNYTAWLRGEPSNFTLYEESDKSILLRQAFLHPPLQLPTTQTAYYSNYTGAYKTKSVRFYNLTQPPNEVSWAPLANGLYREKNLTAIHARAGEWNWTEGYIELEHPNPERGMTEGPSISLRVEGVHIPSNGTLFALVEPKTWYSERIKDLEKAALNGDTRLGDDEGSFVNCSFSFHGHLEPLHTPQNIVEEYEREMKEPSGIPIPKLPRPTFEGILMSEECDSAVTSVVFYVLIQLSLQVSDQWRTATSLLRGSRGHLMAAAATTEARFAVLVPGFLGCVLLVTDLVRPFVGVFPKLIRFQRLLTYLNGVQMLLNQAQIQNQPITTVAATTAPAETRENNNSAPESNVMSQAAPTRSRTPLSIASTIAQYLTADDFRVWLTTVGIFSMICLIFFRVPVYGIWFILVTSTWSAQTANDPLDLFACPDNLIGIEPAGERLSSLSRDKYSANSGWVFILPVWVGLQACVLIGQDYFGPTWFIPSLWYKEVSYDYHPDLAKSDEESVEAKLGDCSICMERISADEGELSQSQPSILDFDTLCSTPSVWNSGWISRAYALNAADLYRRCSSRNLIYNTIQPER
ncbi:975_t:CDS:2, partial [Acaulospora colombiana]